MAVVWGPTLEGAFGLKSWGGEHVDEQNEGKVCQDILHGLKAWELEEHNNHTFYTKC